MSLYPRRSLARPLAALVLVGMALGWATTPASAIVQPEVVVKEGPAFTRTYPAIVGQGAANEQINYPTPRECSSPPGSSYCDVIPVTVQLPKDYDDNSDEYITRVSVAWDDSTGSNIDIFVYNMAQVMTGRSADAADPETTAKHPEVTASADPKFQLVVLNVAGANQGYKVTYTFTRKRFTPVTEKPQFAGGGGGVATPSAPARPTPLPSSTAFAEVTGLSVTPGAPDLPPLDLTDPDFAPGSDLASGIFTGPLAAPDAPQPPQVVSAGLLLVVLGAFPILIVAVGSFFFRRQASRLLRF